MLSDIAFAIWFLLPAGAANVAPIFAARLPGLKLWNTPIDGGLKFQGKELLGSHKTWRGIVTGMIAGLAVFYVQRDLVPDSGLVRAITDGINYKELPLLLGALLGLGALTGDAVKSFFKRRVNVPAGKSWLPFDQLDYILGAIIVSLPFIVFPLSVYFWMLLLWFVAHVMASYIGWLLHLKDEPI